MTTCNCGKPTRDNAEVCDDCTADLNQALAEVPWLTDELETTITKQKAAGTEAGSPSGAVPLPYNLAASEARARLRQVLVMWVRFCDEEQIRNQAPSQEWPADNLPAMSRWLMWRVDGLAFSDLGHQAVVEVTDAVKSCYRAIDRPPERSYAGPCECGRDLYAKPNSGVVKCRGCERTYDVAEMREWMRGQLEGRLVTAREGAGLLSKFGLETQQGTIDKWCERGLVEVRGHNPKQHRLYLFDDLMGQAMRRVA